ncbi:putative serine/threonine-protein kinase drkA [Nannochloris sp. 'desiccata']|nr:putative serine/threonine-protein kinase drkA [Chlorella desiccata (nom. nud.)]
MGSCFSSESLDLELLEAVRVNNIGKVERLVRNGANVNVADNEGHTALMEAAKEGYVDCVKLLLKHGADVNYCDNHSCTALMLAVFNGDVNCLEVLVKHGADVNVADNHGNTALNWAASGGKVDYLEVLLKHGADVNVTNNDGKTALMEAASGGKVDYLEVLLKHGADVNAADNEGKTALMLSFLHYDVSRKVACIEVLLQYVDDIDQIKKTLEHVKGKGKKEIKQSLERHLARLEQKRHNETPRSAEAPAIHASGSSIASPLAWPSTATNTISEPTAPVQTFQPEAGAIPSLEQRRSVSHQTWVIPFDQLQLGTLLGRGSYAEVYRATWHGSEVAAKRFTFPGGSIESEIEFSTMLLKKIKDEADLLAGIRHPHVVAFLGMCSDPPCMVTELCSRGSLFDTMKKCKSNPNLAANLIWVRRLSMLIDAAAGMVHLHQRTPILHRDLKSLNLLVDSAWRVKIADLGLSKMMEEVTTETHAGSTSSNMNARWLAPEVLETGKWLPASDVYSFGVVMWELLTWELPWTHINQFMIPGAILKGDGLPVPDPSALPGPKATSPRTIDRYIDLLKKCMDRNPSRRLSFVDIAARLRELAADEGTP